MSTTAQTTIITFDNRGATTAGTRSKTVTYGSAMPSITVPTKTNYTFGGYYSDTEGTGTQYYTSTGASARTWDKTSATTLYAKWTSDTSTPAAGTTKITLISGVLSFSGTTTVEATNGCALPTIDLLPQRSGYTFDGYYSGTGGTGTKYYNSAGVGVRTWNSSASTATLYANWTVDTTTPTTTVSKTEITLDLQGASVPLIQKPTLSVTATYGSAMPEIQRLPSMTGYTFDGYYDNNGVQYYTPSGASARKWDSKDATATLYAKWILQENYSYLEWERILSEKVDAQIEAKRRAGETINEAVMADVVWHEAHKLQLEYGDLYGANPETYKMLAPLFAIDDPNAPWYVSAINVGFAGFNDGFDWGLCFAAIEAGANGMGGQASNNTLEYQTVDELISGLEETTNKTGVARNFESSGGFEQTLNDFDSLNPSGVKSITTQYGPGKVGTLSDGSTVIARPGSATGGATLEIQISNTKVIKIRY